MLYPDYYYLPGGVYYGKPLELLAKVSQCHARPSLTPYEPIYRDSGMLAVYFGCSIQWELEVLIGHPDTPSSSLDH